MAHKPVTSFEVKDIVVYPTHGPGCIIAIETDIYAGIKVQVYVIAYEVERFTQRVPTHKATELGLRAVASPELLVRAIDILSGKPKVKRGMWSRRAREYEEKINSGDVMALADVVRDLYREPSVEVQPSYSEVKLFELAVTRLVREAAATWSIDETSAAKRLSNKCKKDIGMPASHVQTTRQLQGVVASPLEVTWDMAVNTHPQRTPAPSAMEERIARGDMSGPPSRRERVNHDEPNVGVTPTQPKRRLTGNPNKANIKTATPESERVAKATAINATIETAAKERLRQIEQSLGNKWNGRRK